MSNYYYAGPDRGELLMPLIYWIFGYYVSWIYCFLSTYDKTSVDEFVVVL